MVSDPGIHQGVGEGGQKWMICGTHRRCGRREREAAAGVLLQCS